MTTNGSMMETATIIETTDEDGNVHIFEKIDEYEIEGQRYALMIYQGDDEDGEDEHEHGEGCNHAHDDEDDDDEEFVVFRIIQDEDGMDMFEGLDEEELDRVVAHIEKLADEDDSFPFELNTED